MGVSECVLGIEGGGGELGKGYFESGPLVLVVACDWRHFDVDCLVSVAVAIDLDVGETLCA